MKYIFLIFLLFASFYSKAQTSVNISSKTEKITIHTKYGSLTFDKICDENTAKLQFHTNFKNIDDAVNEEAEKKNITEDAVLITIEVNQTGIISSVKIVKKGKLESFNLYVEKVFNEIILEMGKGSTGKLNCNNEKMSFMFPVNFHIH